MTNSSLLVSDFTVTEIDIVYRNKCRAKDRAKISTSNDAYKILLSNWNMDKIEIVEQFKVLLLNRKNACLGISEVATGGTSACIVDPKVIFATALKAAASSIILAHNHPSGSLSPSPADMKLTHKLHAGGIHLDITVLDHFIITPDGYYSMADAGVMPLPL